MSTTNRVLIPIRTVNDKQEISKLYDESKREELINELKNHYIYHGFGRHGRFLTSTIDSANEFLDGLRDEVNSLSKEQQKQLFNAGIERCICIDELDSLEIQAITKLVQMIDGLSFLMEITDNPNQRTYRIAPATIYDIEIN